MTECYDCGKKIHTDDAVVLDAGGSMTQAYCKVCLPGIANRVQRSVLVEHCSLCGHKREPFTRKVETCCLCEVPICDRCGVRVVVGKDWGMVCLEHLPSLIQTRMRNIKETWKLL